MKEGGTHVSMRVGGISMGSSMGRLITLLAIGYIYPITYHVHLKACLNGRPPLGMCDLGDHNHIFDSCCSALQLSFFKETKKAGSAHITLHQNTKLSWPSKKTVEAG